LSCPSHQHETKRIRTLWRQAIPDREPWRRGRFAIIVIASIVLLGEGLLAVMTVMSGHLEEFPARLLTGFLAALLFYFVWIGQNWVRWLIAPLFLVAGCWDFVWGIVRGDGPMLIAGIASLIVFSYLAISPAVYAFAKHQRERVRLREVMAITGVSFLILLSLGSGVFAFSSYQSAVRADALEFVGLTFHRVFENRDPEFLATHSSATQKHSSPQAFINRIDAELGEVQSVGPVRATFQTKFVPYHLEFRGWATARVVCESAAMWVTIEISGKESAWQIEHVSWEY